MMVLKQVGFLLLMAVLGLVSLLLHTNGYPLAWSFYSGQAYWLPVMFAINALLVGAVLAGVFWLMRGFLFGRGRPYLAWFSIGVWVLVWALFAAHAATTRTAHWPGVLHMGSLSERAQAAQSAEWTLQEIESQSDSQREVICTNAFLEEPHSTVIVRDGLPVSVEWPKDLAEKKLFEGNACPADLKTKYQKYTALRKEISTILSAEDHGLDLIKQLNLLQTAAVSAGLLAHPGNFTAMSEVFKKYKDKPIDRKLALSELELRMYSNGQINDHEWVQMPDQEDDGVKAIYINPQIWSASSSDAPKEDLWRAWQKQVKKPNNNEMMWLMTIDCRRKTYMGEFELAKNDKGQLKLSVWDDKPKPAGAGTWGEEWVSFVCASKDKQVKQPD